MVAAVDQGPGGDVALLSALRYAPRAVVLAPEGAELPDGVSEVVHPGRSGISVDEAFRVAADRGIPWVALPRDLADPPTLLGDLLEATGRRATKDLPGFAALLVGRVPERVDRILAVVDRRDADPSGLMILVAAASALATGAEVDVLLLGAPGQVLPRPERVEDLLLVTREQDLYEQALRSGGDTDRRANWIVVEDVEDRVAVVLDQLVAEHYDLVIEDLGALRLGARLGRRGRIAQALGPDGPGAIVRAILERKDVPVVVVLDGVRLGVVPAGVVKGGAGVLLALGVAASAAPAASATPLERARASDSVSQAVDAYQAALDEAASMAAPADVQEATQSAQEVAVATAEAAASVFSAGSGAVEAPPVERPPAEPPAETTGEAPAEAPAEPSEAPTQEAAADASTTPDEVAPEEVAPEEVAPADLAPEEVDPEAAPKVDKDSIKAPKDVDAKDVKKAEKAEDESAADLREARKEFDEAQEQAVDTADAAQQAADEAERAAAVLAAAEAAFQQTVQQTEGVINDATGLTGVLPGGASEVDLAAAEQAQAEAYAAVESAGVVAAAALAEYNAAAQEATTSFAALEEASAKVTEVDATHKEAAAEAKATSEAYRKAMAAARVSPAPGHGMTTRFGAHGSRWSTGRHTGVDFPAPTGSPVVAAASGRVVSTGYDGAYGNRVVIEHSNGLTTTYNHLSSITTHVGAEVTAGDRIGQVGATGNAFGSHLHFEVTRGGDGWSSGTFLDPAAWLAGKDG
jgi:murein DD-endopeptidase MepM/ murein hydrolase activator NlpD